MCENFLRFRPFGPELWGKRVFSKVGLSHFFHIFCVKVNVRISYMSTFFEAMVLKLLHGVFRSYCEVCVKIFCDFVHSGPNYGEKGFFEKWDLVSEHKYRLSFWTGISTFWLWIHVIYLCMIYKLKDIYYMYDYNYR